METLKIRSVLALLVLFGACSLIPAIQANKFWHCTKKGYIVRVHDVIISPQPVINGRYTTFTMTGTPGLTIPNIGLKWEIEISNSSELVISDKYTLCEETTCPLEAGQLFTLSKTKIYKWLQPGTYTLTMRITGKRSSDLACIHSSFEIADPAYSYIRKVSDKCV